MTTLLSFVDLPKEQKEMRGLLHTPWESASAAYRISAFSLKELAVGMLPLMKERGGAIVTLDFDNSVHAWPSYDWMGVTKAALVSIVRYLARDLGRFVYDRGGVDVATRGHLSRTIAAISASHTTSPSTLATPFTRQTGPRIWMISTSNRS